MTDLELKRSMDYKRDYLAVASQLYYWMKERPDNQTLKALALCISDMDTYTSSLSSELRAAKELLNTKNNPIDN